MNIQRHHRRNERRQNIRDWLCIENAIHTENTWEHHNHWHKTDPLPTYSQEKPGLRFAKRQKQR